MKRLVTLTSLSFSSFLSAPSLFLISSFFGVTIKFVFLLHYVTNISEVYAYAHAHSVAIHALSCASMHIKSINQ